MKVKRVFLIINTILTFLCALLAFGYVVASVFYMDLFSAKVTDWVLYIANHWWELDVIREDLVDGVILFMMAFSIIMLCISVLKLTFAIKQIKYCRMSYKEFYASRHKYVGLIIFHFFTVSLVLELLNLSIILTAKTKEEKEMENDLKSGSVKDVKTDVFQGTGIGSNANNLMLHTGPKINFSYYDQREDEKARNNAMDLWRSGAITEKQYQKIIKKLDKKRK